MNIDRRSLFRSLLGTAGTLLASRAGALPATAPASIPTAVPASPTAGRLLQESPLAGFQYYEGERIWPRLRVGHRLTLRRRPDNPHDDRAVEVWWRDRMLGHLPRMDNCAASQMLDRGERLSARITALRTAENPWERMCLAVELA